jgi:hypothetical protein
MARLILYRTRPAESVAESDLGRARVVRWASARPLSLGPRTRAIPQAPPGRERGALSLLLGVVVGGGGVALTRRGMWSSTLAMAPTRTPATCNDCPVPRRMPARPTGGLRSCPGIGGTGQRWPMVERPTARAPSLRGRRHAAAKNRPNRADRASPPTGESPPNRLPCSPILRPFPGGPRNPGRVERISGQTGLIGSCAGGSRRGRSGWHNGVGAGRSVSAFWFAELSSSLWPARTQTATLGRPIRPNSVSGVSTRTSISAGDGPAGAAVTNHGRPPPPRPCGAFTVAVPSGRRASRSPRRRGGPAGGVTPREVGRVRNGAGLGIRW